MAQPGILIRLKRTESLLTDASLNGVVPKFGEPVFSHTSTKDELVIGDGVLDIPHLPRLNLTALNTISSNNSLSVAYGGTGVSSLPVGEVLVGNGQGAVTTRGIDNQTTAGGDVTASNKLITANTLVNYKGSTNQNTVGTITTGTWQGSPVGVAYGGTGRSSLPTGNVLIGNGTDGIVTRTLTNNTTPIAAQANDNIITQNTLYNATANINGARQTSSVGIFAPTSAGTKNQILVSNGSGAPIWLATNVGAAYVDSSNGSLTFGTLPINRGGTNATTAANALKNLVGTTAIGTVSSPVYWDGSKFTAGTTYAAGTAVTLNGSSKSGSTASFYAPTASGTANQILVSGGSNTAPTWKATANGAAYATSSNGALTFGILPVSCGGTGSNSIATAASSLNIPIVNFGTNAPTSSSPSSKKTGDFYLNTSTGFLYVYNGSSWLQVYGAWK